MFLSKVNTLLGVFVGHVSNNTCFTWEMEPRNQGEACARQDTHEKVLTLLGVFNDEPPKVGVSLDVYAKSNNLTICC